MKLSLLFSMLVLAMVTTVLVSPPAEAKRLGGFSFGKSYKYSRPAKPRTAPVQNTRNLSQPAGTAGSAGRTGRRGGMMGMLGGLAAGGLLGALFFGGAFENINFFDILLLGGLVFGGMALMKALRRGSATSAYQRQAPAAGASGFPAPEAHPPQSGNNRGFEIPEIGSGLKGEPLSVKPDWFNEQAFMAEAANHFHTLQKAWDSGNMEQIREYTTPEFFEFISRERAALPARQETKIIDLNPQLLDLLKDGDNVVAAILFNGYEQEGTAEPEAFADIWHVEHPADDPNADWLLAGIRKLDDVQ